MASVMTAQRPPAVQVHDVPDVVLAVVPGHDYVDLFEVAAPGAIDWTAEEWARTALENASAVGRFLAWQLALGLRLDHRPAAERVVGWRIGERGERRLQLTARSWCMTAHIVFLVAEDRLSVATFITYDRRIAALVWRPVSARHRALMPRLLQATARHMARVRAGGAGSGTAEPAP